MLRTVVALERDGLDIRALTLVFEVPGEDFDLVAAAHAAATEYINGKEGRKIYEYNCSAFNWADFAMYVPAELCEKHGFKKMYEVLPDIVVDWDEDLVDEVKGSYTAFLYEDDGITAADLSTYDDPDEAIDFAQTRGWDEVVDDISGTVVWRK